MNNRIREIAERCGVAIWGDAVYMHDAEDTLDSAVMERFAQLIIADCLNTCAAYADCYGVAQTIAQHIRSDFGIEEKNT